MGTLFRDQEERTEAGQGQKTHWKLAMEFARGQCQCVQQVREVLRMAAKRGDDEETQQTSNRQSIWWATSEEEEHSKHCKLPIDNA